MNDIKQLTESNLLQFVHRLIAEKESKDLEQKWGSEDFKNGFGSTFLKPINPFFKRIILNHAQEKLSSMIFYGDFDLEFLTLSKLLGDNRKVYVAHDDVFYYFFNENGKAGDFILKTYSAKNIEKELDWEIKNIAVVFQ